MPLRYLRDGRLFQFEIKSITQANLDTKSLASLSGQLSRRVFHFWLCGQCSSTLTLAFDTLKGVIVRPRQAA
jgi:hypothetical protein